MGRTKLPPTSSDDISSAALHSQSSLIPPSSTPEIEHSQAPPTHHPQRVSFAPRSRRSSTPYPVTPTPSARPCTPQASPPPSGKAQARSQPQNRSYPS